MMEPGVRADAAAVLDRLLLARDESGFNRALVLMVMVGNQNADDLADLATERLETMPHEVQLFWAGTCNCGGHLN